MTNKQKLTETIENQMMISWGAGLFEGEGSFCFHKGKPKSVQITSTDYDVLEKMVLIFGGKIYKDSRKNQKAHWKDAYVWKLALINSLDFFEKIKPFLGKRRLERGEEFVRIYSENIKKRQVKSEEVLRRFAKVFELRNEGLTHAKIAETLKIDRTYVTKILNGV